MADEQALTTQERQKLRKYMRGTGVSTKKIPKLRQKKDVQRHEAKIKEAAMKTMDAEMLLTEDQGYLEAEGMERTFKFRQDQIQKHLDVTSVRKGFQLELNEHGPYYIDYTRNGRHLLIGGRGGHMASFDWKTGKLGMEVNLNEKIYDVKWLHNESMFAVAQKDCVYVYDHTGAEMHCLRQHANAYAIDFLPYHFLLTTVGAAGVLRYQDTSMGTVVAEHRTKMGQCSVMTQNPWNAIMHLGHANGVVSLWSPNMSTPLVKMLCHKGPVTAMAIDSTGHYMATAGLDGQMKVWDIRKYEPIHQYFTRKPATSLSISQKGLLSVSYGAHIDIWRNPFKTKQNSPYMTHLQPSNIVHDISFCPYDDVLGVGHTGGITSLIVPGAGEANFDALESNPFETGKQRQNREIHSLLDKIQPEMITLDPMKKRLKARKVKKPIMSSTPPRRRLEVAIRR